MTGGAAAELAVSGTAADRHPRRYRRDSGVHLEQRPHGRPGMYLHVPLRQTPRVPACHPGCAVMCPAREFRPGRPARPRGIILTSSTELLPTSGLSARRTRASPLASPLQVTAEHPGALLPGTSGLLLPHPRTGAGTPPRHACLVIIGHLRLTA